MKQGEQRVKSRLRSAASWPRIRWSKGGCQTGYEVVNASRQRLWQWCIGAELHQIPTGTERDRCVAGALLREGEQGVEGRAKRMDGGSGERCFEAVARCSVNGSRSSKRVLLIQSVQSDTRLRCMKVCGAAMSVHCEASNRPHTHGLYCEPPTAGCYADQDVLILCVSSEKASQLDHPTTSRDWQERGEVIQLSRIKRLFASQIADEHSHHTATMRSSLEGEDAAAAASAGRRRHHAECFPC